MARIHALPAESIIRGYKGTLDFYLWRGLPCVRAWPRWRPALQSEASKNAALLFGAIIKGYSLLGEGPLVAFREAAADQPRSARDIYATAVFGHLHERTEPPPPPPPPEVRMTGSWLDTEDPTYSTSPYPWKGNYAKPMRDLVLHALGAKGLWPQGIHLKFGVFTVAGGVVASVVHKSPGVTIPTPLDVDPSESRIWEAFDPPWALAAGTLYLIMVGRSDGADNFVLPVGYPADFQPAPFPAHENTTGSGRVAKADPLVGHAVDHYLGTAHLLATWEFT